jgi:hypothetical protein
VAGLPGGWLRGGALRLYGRPNNSIVNPVSLVTLSRPVPWTSTSRFLRQEREEISRPARIALAELLASGFAIARKPNCRSQTTALRSSSAATSGGVHYC